MSVLDLSISVIVLFGLWRGWRLGLIQTMLSMVGWFIALVAATRLADDVAPSMAAIVASPVLQTALGFLAVVLVVMVVIHLLGWIASSTINALKLGIFDRFFGAMAGAGKSLLVVLVLLSVLSPIIVRSSMWQTSQLAPALLPYSPFAKQFASDVLGEAWDQLNHP
ncbi:CvpA family protein [Psychrobacter sp. I-STPA10]|uniref:CvpA family protein n=1 Tax=Psychrobacter sp. I-STPA10 TaxID=2585769 RepID=UPI001E53FC5C|nr:CvpA family protein [Psychrobacter sp. I-STPA10]